MAFPVALLVPVTHQLDQMFRESRQLIHYSAARRDGNMVYPQMVAVEGPYWQHFEALQWRTQLVLVVQLCH